MLHLNAESLKTVSVLGAGSWGSAVAHLLAAKGYAVELWAREPEVALSINEQHENRLFHPGKRLHANVHATIDLTVALKHAPLLVVAIPTQYIRTTLKAHSVHLRDKFLVSIAKGIEKETLMTVSQVLRDLEPGLTPKQIATLSGPSFATEVLAGQPTALTLACADKKTALELQKVFHAPTFRAYVVEDQLGVELGGAIKNVIAIGVGVVEGLGYGNNARAALMTRALAELTRLAVKMGAEAQTLSGLAGVGDLILTCTGDLSRNRSLGLKIGRGEKLADLLKASPMIAEGVETARSAGDLAKKFGVDMPIVEQVYLVLHENKSPRQAAQDLLSRDPKAEFTSS